MKRNSAIHLISGLLLSSAMAPVARAEDAFAQRVKPFLKKHCIACHGPQRQKAGIRYDRLEAFQVSDRHLWTLVHQKLSGGEMPPESRPQPTADEKGQILSWIVKEQRATRAGGARRLNRRELSEALQDVTGRRIDFSHSLPEDGKLAGFDTGVTTLQDTADSIAKIMEVTRRAVYGIRFLEPDPSLRLTADLQAAKDTRRVFDSWKKAGAYAKVRGTHQQGRGLFIDPKWLGERGGLKFNVLPPKGGHGVLRLQLTVSAFKGNFPGIPNPHLWVEVGNRTFDHREITATVEKPEVLVYEVQVDDLPLEKRGLAITIHNKVEMPYAVKGFPNDERARPGEKIPGGTGLFRPAFDRKKKVGPEQKPYPFIVLQKIEVDQGSVAIWPPPQWQAKLGKIEDDLDSARRLLALWMERAWRRPPGQDAPKRFLELYQKLRGKGMCFDNALRATFQSVLFSSPFRYMASSADPVPGQYAIASRLGFMLTGAPPDAELLRLAAAGDLRKGVLDAQVDRLLKDPRSEAFLEPFVTQWLELGQPITLAMDHIKKQDFRFGRFLKESMQNETIAYVGQLIRENRPARELIDSNWTLMNNILARHYGYPGIEGSHLRKVELRKDDPRGGGILGHAGIQSMLCWMGDNWVIYRGAWTLRHILDDPPPPPPLEVPELSPSDGSNRGKTFKELLKQHQEDSRCSICHKSIDPLGFAFQNFDLSGRWREVEHESYKRAELDGKIEWHGVGKTRPADTVGQLPGGEEFRSFSECKELMVKHYQKDMVRGVLKNLMIYGTGRIPDVEDLAEIEAMLNQAAKTGYRWKDLLKAIVRSQAFLSG